MGVAGGLTPLGHDGFRRPINVSTRRIGLCQAPARTAYDVAEWSDLAVAGAGAAAALTGLLFVAVSINLTRILEFSYLPERAMETLSLLLGLLVVPLLMLTPGQPRALLGTEIAVTGAVLVGICTVIARKSAGPRTSLPLGRVLAPLLLLLLPAACFVVSGISLAVGTGGGLYWATAGMVMGFASAALNAWVFLVEIQR